MGMLNIIDVSSARAQNAKTELTSNVWVTKPVWEPLARALWLHDL